MLLRNERKTLPFHSLNVMNLELEDVFQFQYNISENISNRMNYFISCSASDFAVFRKKNQQKVAFSINFIYSTVEIRRLNKTNSSRQ